MKKNLFSGGKIMEIVQSDKKRILIFPNLSSPHIITTIDHGDITEVLFSKKVNGFNSTLLRNFGTEIVTPLANLHRDEIIVLKENDGLLRRADGLFCISEKNEKANKLLGFTTGDCPYIIIEGQNKRNRIAGAVHCGWNGTALNIAEKTIGQIKKYGFKPSSLNIALWNGICPECYEIGSDVKNALRPYKEHLVFKKKGKWSADLAGINKSQLFNAGIQPEQINESGICSHCYRDKEGKPLFYSHRRGDKTARNGIFIA